MDGHPEGHNAPVNYRGVNLQKAKRLMAKAGYPDGKGPDGKPLPPLKYFTSKQPESLAMAEMNKRALKKIGVNLQIESVDFATLSEMLRAKRATCFGLAWGSDYPDAENNLQLFKMRDMIIEDVPMIGSMARTRNYLIHDRLQNFKPVEVFSNWPKYLNLKTP